MKKVIVNDQYKELISALISDDSFKGLAVYLLVFTGARSNEILKANYSHIDVSKTSVKIFIKASKQGNDRWISLPLESYARVLGLREKLKDRGCTLAALINDGSLNPITAYKVIRIYFNKLQSMLFGEILYTLHSLRHTMATRALISGKNIFQVKTILGHRSIESSLVYLREYEQSLVLDDVHLIVQGAL